MSVKMYKLWQGRQPGQVHGPDPSEDVIISYSASIPLVATDKILLTVDAQVVFTVMLGTQRSPSACLRAERSSTCCFYRTAITLLDLGFPANKSVVLLMGW